MGRTAWTAQGSSIALCPTIPSARVVGTHVPSSGADPVTGRSFLAVVVESCIELEHLGNRARPHLHHAHPMVTAEPAQRHDGRWHLYIFSFLLHWIKSRKQGCRHWATRVQQSVLCTPLVGMGLLESLAHQPAKTLCVKEAACSAPVGLCNQLFGQTELVTASLTDQGGRAVLWCPSWAAVGVAGWAGGFS